MSNNGTDENLALDVTSEFIEESKKADLVKPSKKFAPWTKEERRKRIAEVYRLHIEHGLPATRIAEMMSVDKNTIYSDIKAIYAQIRRDAKHINFDNMYAKQMVRMEAQRTRLMSYLNDVKEIDKKITIERLLVDIETRLLTSAEKVEYGEYKTLATTMEDLNDKMKKAGKEERYITLDTVLHVSPDAWQTIRRVLQKEGILKK